MYLNCQLNIELDTGTTYEQCLILAAMGRGVKWSMTGSQEPYVSAASTAAWHFPDAWQHTCVNQPSMQQVYFLSMKWVVTGHTQWQC